MAADIFGDYGTKTGYAAEVDRLAEKLALAKQTLRDHQGRKANGATKIRGGYDIDYAIGVVMAKVAEAQDAYDRAKAEL